MKVTSLMDLVILTSELYAKQAFLVNAAALMMNKTEAVDPDLVDKYAKELCESLLEVGRISTLVRAKIDKGASDRAIKLAAGNIRKVVPEFQLAWENFVSLHVPSKMPLTLRPDYEELINVLESIGKGKVSSDGIEFKCHWLDRLNPFQHWVTMVAPDREDPDSYEFLARSFYLKGRMYEFRSIDPDVIEAAVTVATSKASPLDLAKGSVDIMVKLIDVNHSRKVSPALHPTTTMGVGCHYTNIMVQELSDMGALNEDEVDGYYAGKQPLNFEMDYLNSITQQIQNRYGF